MSSSKHMCIRGASHAIYINKNIDFPIAMLSIFMHWNFHSSGGQFMINSELTAELHSAFA